MDASRKYLNPATLAKVGSLDLKARLIVEGYLSGMHRSPFQGFSVEFAEHREYVSGDDLRYVDWKVFGRTDRHYLKLYDEETNFCCWIVVDTSESMDYQSDGAAVCKLEYARYLAAALSWLVVRQQDAVGLATFDESISGFLRPGGTPAHLNQVIQMLSSATAGGETAIGSILHDLADRARRRGLVIVLSDLFDDPDSILRGLRNFRFRNHDVSVLQIVDPAEEDFPFDGPTMFRGMESPVEQFLEPASLRKAYQQEFRDFVKTIGQQCHQLGFDHHLIRTDQPFDVAISAFLKRRRRKRRTASK